MPRVAVVGGGVAGVFAALAVARRGAHATLLESSQKVGASRALMPMIVSEGLDEGGIVLPEAKELSKAGVEVRTGFEAAAVVRKDGGLEVVPRAHRGERLGFDSVVVCTGAAASPPQLRGISKPGVFLLKTAEDYVAVSDGLGSMDRVVVSGPVLLGLKMGEVLSKKGKTVTVYCGRGGLAGQFSSGVAARLRDAALGGEAGDLSIVEGSIESILGVKKVEAVTSGGSVSTCDAVVLVPRSAPSFPETGCTKGPSGGMLVDASMATSLAGVFAAGDAAEVRFRAGSVPARLFSTGATGGEVAGVNAAGGRAVAAFSWAMQQTILGVEYCSAGLRESEAPGLGLDPATVAGAFGGGDRRKETLVSMVYDRSTRRVYGIEVAGWRASSLSAAASMVVALGLTADQLVHLESPYAPGLTHEISPISLTARRIAELQGD